jgi:hypothetical protein
MEMLMVTILLFYISQKEYQKKCERFFEHYYHTSFEDPILSGNNVCPTSEFIACSMLLFVTEN